MANKTIMLIWKRWQGEKVVINNLHTCIESRIYKAIFIAPWIFASFFSSSFHSSPCIYIFLSSCSFPDFSSTCSFPDFSPYKLRYSPLALSTQPLFKFIYQDAPDIYLSALCKYLRTRLSFFRFKPDPSESEESRTLEIPERSVCTISREESSLSPLPHQLHVLDYMGSEPRDAEYTDSPSRAKKRGFHYPIFPFFPSHFDARHTLPPPQPFTLSNDRPALPLLKPAHPRFHSLIMFPP